MIVQAIKKQTVDVEIDPTNVLEEMRDLWKLSVCSVPTDATLTLGGNWYDEDKAFIRRASKREIQTSKAFMTLMDLAEELEL